MKQLVLITCFLVAACTAGSGDGLDANGRPIGEALDPSDEPTLANIQARIFTPVCTQCHVGAAAPQGLRLDSTNAFDDLVNVPSREVGSLRRVEPFDPDRSYLVQKIEGTAGVGGRMPLGGPPLPDADIQLVRQWISDGALPTSTASSKGVGQVRAIQMHTDQGSVRIRLSFTNKLDATSILPTSVQLVRTATGHPVDIISVDTFGNAVVPATNDYAFDVILGPNTLAGDYRLSIGPSSPTTITDVSGYAVEPYTLEFQVETQ